AHAAGDEPVGLQAHDALAVDGDVAAAHLHHAEDRLQQRRLAGAVGADDADQLAAVGDEIRTVDDVDARDVTGDEIADLHHDIRARVGDSGLGACFGSAHRFSSSASAIAASSSSLISSR